MTDQPPRLIDARSSGRMRQHLADYAAKLERDGYTVRAIEVRSRLPELDPVALTDADDCVAAARGAVDLLAHTLECVPDDAVAGLLERIAGIAVGLQRRHAKRLLAKGPRGMAELHREIDRDQQLAAAIQNSQHASREAVGS